VNQLLPSTQVNEDDLISCAQQGDRHAFGELVRQHHSGVINVVYRLCADVHLAEDAAQEAFIRAWQNLNRYKPKSPFRNWLYRIAVNVALDALRRERVTSDVDDYPISSSGRGPEAALECRQRAAQVQEAILALPPASRVVLVLREYQGLSYGEIAETLRIPVGTVMSRLNYARQLLRNELGHLMEAA
jgi:RNA polymerase sigma-70 factor (ECF subfamily)